MNEHETQSLASKDWREKNHTSVEPTGPQAINEWTRHSLGQSTIERENHSQLRPGSIVTAMMEIIVIPGIIQPGSVHKYDDSYVRTPYKKTAHTRARTEKEKERKWENERERERERETETETETETMKER